MGQTATRWALMVAAAQRRGAVLGVKAFRSLAGGWAPGKSFRADGPRAFATAAFKVPAEGGRPELSLFVVGLNQGKFFGQDSAEEGLKLVEQIAQHTPEYHMLFGMTEKELREIETDHPAKDGRLTTSRELEGSFNCEMIPLVQATMVDKRPRKALDRPYKVLQAHVAYALAKNWREAIWINWGWWKRRQYKDAARYDFFGKNFPIAAFVAFNQTAHLIAIRTTEHLANLRAQGQGASTVLIVRNEVFSLVVERLRMIVDEDVAEKLNTPEVMRGMRDYARELSAEIADFSLLLYLVCVIPAVAAAQGLLVLASRGYHTAFRSIEIKEERD